MKTSSEYRKLASKSELYNDFVVKKIAPGEIASSEIGNMYTASIFMSLLSMLNNAITKNIELTNNKIGFISYGSGSKAKIFEGTVQKNWIEKINSIKLYDSLSKRKKISIDVYENLHKRRVTSNINNNDGIIKLNKISDGEFTEGLRNYLKY